MASHALRLNSSDTGIGTSSKFKSQCDGNKYIYFSQKEKKEGEKNKKQTQIKTSKQKNNLHDISCLDSKPNPFQMQL